VDALLVASRAVTVTVPTSVADALDAEAVRRNRRRGEILAEFIALCWPEFVAAALRADLHFAADLDRPTDPESGNPVSDSSGGIR
jgi:hypothetical protein